MLGAIALLGAAGALGQRLEEPSAAGADIATLQFPFLPFATEGFAGTAGARQSFVFDTRGADELRSESRVMRVFVEGFPDERKSRPIPLETRFTSALHGGSPELITGRMYGDCMYTGLGFSCADPISSLIMNGRTFRRFR